MQQLYNPYGSNMLLAHILRWLDPLAPTPTIFETEVVGALGNMTQRVPPEDE